uniref:Uncharacterized protein n=1 Tax=Anguilla anguilla TaxID=7936 RepID=A0A0E9W0N8_ANGAN
MQVSRRSRKARTKGLNFKCSFLLGLGKSDLTLVTRQVIDVLVNLLVCCLPVALQEIFKQVC